MNDDYSYVEVPATTQEAMEEDHDHALAVVEFPESETLAVSGPELDSEAPMAPTLSSPTEWKSLVAPIGALVFAAVLALTHHAFNQWVANGKTVTQFVIPQHWVNRIGVGIPFAFKSAVGVTMGFVLLQCLWLSVVRQSLTIQQIDTIYWIERQGQLYKTLPQALFFSPIIVVFLALTLLLPLSGVFAPSSLTVVIRNSSRLDDCTIPSGNISTDSTSSDSFMPTYGYGDKIMRWFSEMRIPDLPVPQACRANCKYNVSFSSFVFQCTPNPASLPYGQAGLPQPHDLYANYNTTLWNGTGSEGLGPGGFYIAWKSNGPNHGTSGNASCKPSIAQYNVEVMTKGGVQTVSVTANAAQIKPLYTINSYNRFFSSRLISMFSSTRDLFLGVAVLENGWRYLSTRPTVQPSFLNITHIDPNTPKFDWGDVLKGIEEMSHNVSAGLLTLDLGMTNSTCSFDQQDVVYEYSPFALWVPYGTALGVALFSLVVAIIMMVKNNTGHITTSFSDTAILMRNMYEKILAGAKLRLRPAEDGRLEYMVV